MDVKRTNSTSNVGYSAEASTEAPKQSNKGINVAQDSFEKMEPKGSLLIDLTPEEIQRARKGVKAPTPEPQKKESEFSKKAKEIANFVGNAAQEALMQWAGKASPIPMPPTPPDPETGKEMHKGVTILQEMKDGNYEFIVDQKGRKTE
jgi:hypothetical protein